MMRILLIYKETLLPDNRKADIRRPMYDADFLLV